MIRQQHVAWATLLVSAGVHVWLFSVAPSQSRDVPAVMASSVTFQVVEAPAPEPPPDPLPEPVPEPEPPEPPPMAPEPKEPEPATPEPVDPSPAEPEAPESPTDGDPPPELQGTTLAAEDAAWAAPPGSGSERRGPLRAGVSRPVPTPSRRAAPAAPERNAPASPAAEALPLSQLSRPPQPPALGGALQRNYPSHARQQGKAGEAKVRARIEPSGRIQLAKVVQETSEGFGAACQKTLLASQWTAPLDKKGKPAATWVSYRCKFRIDR